MKKLVECWYSLFTIVKRELVLVVKKLCDIALDLVLSTIP